MTPVDANEVHASCPAESAKVPEARQQKPLKLSLKVAKAAHRLALYCGKLVCRIRCVRLPVEALDPELDFAHVEASRLEIEIKIEDGKLLGLLCQELVVPGSVLRQPVVGDCEGAPLGAIKMFDRDGWHSDHASSFAARIRP